MDPERWKEIERLCQSVLEKEREKRDAYLKEACAGDESLRKEVRALLEQQAKAEGFLNDPAIEDAAKVLAKEQWNALARDLIGRTIAHYHLVEKIGQGGMGEVFLADDTLLHRRVALKFLPPEMQQDPVAHKRFVREARSAASLDHPFICSIHEVGESEGKDFIVMEYVDGQTLMDKLRRKRLPLNQVLQIAAEVAEALQVAHGKGIIHRDLKPSNIMLTKTGHAKVMDFGLAKQQWPAGGVESREESVSTMTRTGVTLGTLAYMSPEQVRGEALDARSDIFSFGLVLYEMLTGMHPFQKESPMETASAILHEDPRPVGAMETEIPLDLDKLTSRCLRKDLDRRFQHIDDVKIILDELKRVDPGGFGEVPSTLKTQGTRRRKMVWMASATAILIAVSFAAWRLLRTSGPDLPEQRIMPITSYPGNEENPSFSPDGAEVVFSWDKPGVGNPDIYRKLIGPGEPLRLTSDPARDISPAWSPDGRSIAFVRDSGGPKWEILMLPALGGQERKLAEVTRPYEMDGPFIAWTPDGTALVIMDRDPPGAPSGLFLLSAVSRERRRLTSPPAGAHGDSSMSFSPDGRNLAFIRSTAVAVDDGLYVLSFSPGFSPKGETRRLCFDQARFGCCPVWTPDGREIIFLSRQSGGGQLRRLLLFGNDPPRPLAITGDVRATLAISRQGNRLAYGVGMDDRDIWSLDISGAPGKARSPVKVISSSRDDILPRLSPDAKKSQIDQAIGRSGLRPVTAPTRYS